MPAEKTDRDGFSRLHGPLPVCLRTSGGFRALLQACPPVLRSFSCALLGLEEPAVREVSLLSPAAGGAPADGADGVLDVRVQGAGGRCTALGLLLAGDAAWEGRALRYAAGTFRALNHPYDPAPFTPVVQCTVLDSSRLPPEAGERKFFSSFRMGEDETGRVLSDSLRICMLDLAALDRATQRDRACRLDLWGRVFRADTWEELQALSGALPALRSAAVLSAPAAGGTP